MRIVISEETTLLNDFVSFLIGVALASLFVVIL